MEQPVRVAVLFGTQKSYQTASALLEKALSAKGCTCIPVELPRSTDKPGREAARKRLIEAEPVVVVAAGSAATTFVLEAISDIPVVFFMVPNVHDAPFVQEGNPHRRRVAGVTTDVAPEDQLDWITRVHSAGTKLGVLHSERTTHTVEAIQEAARARGIEIVPILAAKDAFPKAVEALDAQGCDGVLMIPDARIYNTVTIKRLLLWGIRQKKPVWAFSENLVKAGAFAGLYSDRPAVARQTADLVLEILNHTDPATIGLRYPHQVKKAVNVRTSEMIGVPMSDVMISARIFRFGDES